MHIYPDHLKTKASIWLWQLKDLTTVGMGVLLSVLAVTQTGIVIPAILTAVYAFLSIRFEDTSILDFLCYASAFFFRPMTGTTWCIS